MPTGVTCSVTHTALAAFLPVSLALFLGIISWDHFPHELLTPTFGLRVCSEDSPA